MKLLNKEKILAACSILKQIKLFDISCLNSSSKDCEQQQQSVIPKEIFRIQTEHKDYINSLSFSFDERIIVSVGDDNNIIIYEVNLDQQQKLQQVCTQSNLHSKQIRKVEFLSMFNQEVVTTENKQEMLKTLASYIILNCDVSYKLITASEDCSVKVIIVTRAFQKNQFGNSEIKYSISILCSVNNYHSDSILNFFISNNVLGTAQNEKSFLLVTSSKDNSLKVSKLIFNTALTSCKIIAISKIYAHQDWIWGLSVSKDLHWILSGANDKSMNLYELIENQQKN